MNKNWGIALFGLLVLALIGFFLFKERDSGFDEKAPETLKLLAGAKAKCEGFVIRLNKKGLDGEGKYNEAFNADHACVAFLTGVVDGPQVNEEKINKELKHFDNEVETFCKWADDQLKGKEPPVGELPFDPAQIITELLKTIHWQSKEKREELKREIEKHKFRRWDEIIRK